MIASCLLALALAQDPPPATAETLAIVGARIVPVTREEIAAGTLLVRDGKIVEIGPSVTPPPGSRIIEAKGLFVCPGFVHPGTRIVTRGPGGSSGSGNNLHVLAYDELSPASDILEVLPRTGFTTLAVPPAGGTLAGQAVALKPSGAFTRDDLVVEKALYLKLEFAPSTEAKDLLRKEFESAKAAVEADRKKEQDPKAKGEKQPDKVERPNEPLIRYLKGELPAVVHLPTPAAFLHYRQVARPFDVPALRTAFVLPVEAYRASEPVGAIKARVVLPAATTFLPYTRVRVNPAAELRAAGAAIALIPASDRSVAAFEEFRFRVAELVKFGLDRDSALRAMTIVPAEMLGLERRVGSLEPGKDADFLVFDGDPLDPISRLVRVFINGKAVIEP